MRRMAVLTWAATAARLLIWVVCVLASANRAHAQCSARDVLQRQLVLKATPVVPTRLDPVTSVSDVAEWKMISIGTFPDTFALLTALSAIGCGVGNSAAEALARPAFTLSVTRTAATLLTVTAADLGFKGETVPLRQIYELAQQLGFGLAPPEIRSAAQTSISGPARR